MMYQRILEYLEKSFHGDVEIKDLREISGNLGGERALKGFGYGNPLRVRFSVEGREQQVVVHRLRRNAFGRERDSDRVAAVWLDFDTFNDLPRHVPALDRIALMNSGELHSLKNAEDLLLVTGYRPGQLYAEDLKRIQKAGKLLPIDVERAEVLGSYLAEIHQVEHEDPSLWYRRLRDLIGHGEGIMGLIDNYPEEFQFTSQSELQAIEQAANRWRWKLKPYAHRLRQVHGDFHPFNILFEEGLDFHLLDRSRGAWGEPADDVSSMSLNYLFFSLQQGTRFGGVFRELHDRFWESYLHLRPDPEMLTVIQPWLVWRALVLASPVWYPNIKGQVRKALFDFIYAVLSSERYDYQKVGEYLK